MLGEQGNAGLVVHCRIGSSEKIRCARQNTLNIHCRIGSSENVQEWIREAYLNSLPNRQLRKACTGQWSCEWHSLPNRQLRKFFKRVAASSLDSLPNRQLRKTAKTSASLFQNSLPNRQLRNTDSRRVTRTRKFTAE